MDPVTFQEALIATYLDNPSQMLPKALWKTFPLLETCQMSFELENGSFSRLEMMNERQK